MKKLKRIKMTIEEASKLSDVFENNWKNQCRTKENQKYADDINSILTDFGIKETINYTDLVRLKTNSFDQISLAYFTQDDPKKLARIIEEFIWKKVEKDTYLYHFTKKNYAKSIVKHETLRLYCILKRYTDGEVKDFINDFNIPYEYKETYKDIFYSSFTYQVPRKSDKRTIKEFS